MVKPPYNKIGNTKNTLEKKTAPCKLHCLFNVFINPASLIESCPSVWKSKISSKLRIRIINSHVFVNSQYLLYHCVILSDSI